MSSIELDAPHAAGGEHFSDALTIAFGDARADTYGIARLGIAGATASGLMLLFHGGSPIAVAAEGVVALDEPPASWDAVAAAGIDVAEIEPSRAWRLQFAGEDASVELELEASGPAAVLEASHPVAREGGMEGFDQPLRVRGSVTAGDARVTLDGLGERGRSWGTPDWERVALARTVSAWLSNGPAISLTAIRPAAATDHAAEAVAASIVEGAGDAARACAVDDARLSTTYDGDGRQRSAGLELWVGPDDEYPRRAAGEVVCGTSLDLGRLRLDCAFVHWHMEGREGIGRYDVLRRAS